MKKETLFLVGESKSDDGSVWEIQGIFKTKKEAISICKKDRHFIWEIFIGKDYGDKTTEMGDSGFFSYYKDLKK